MAITKESYTQAKKDINCLKYWQLVTPDEVMGFEEIPPANFYTTSILFF